MRSRSKYHNKKTVVDGITFDSKREAERYSELCYLKKAGIINRLTLQRKYKLLDPYVIDGKKKRGITYVADFEYWDEEKDRWIVEDVKGFETEVFKLKRKLFESKYGMEIMIIK